jgi:hypothetical protein
VVALTLNLEAREHAPGTAVALHPGGRGVYASYDPAQISEADAVRAIGLVAKGCPDALEVCTAGGRERSSVEGIAKHGGSL